MDRGAREIALGSVLVSLLDPAPGEEVAFHRWYERDPFYAGALVGPWFFSGRRFVATRLAGHHAEAERWAVDQVNRLIEGGRVLPSRRPVHAGFYQHRWGVFRDADGVLDEDPRRCWPRLFEPQADRLRASGLGRISFAAPFISTLPGSDRYTDELW